MASSPDGTREDTAPVSHEHDENEVLREGGRTETEELHRDRFTINVQNIKEVTLQIASAGRILGPQMAALHNTVCKETNAGEENGNFPPALYDKLRARTADLECEIRVLDGHLKQLRKLLLLKQTHDKGVKELTDIASCRENSETQQLSFKELRKKLEATLEEEHTVHNDKKEFISEVERLEGLLQSGENLASSGAHHPLNGESVGNVVNKELENDSKLLRQRSRIIQDKLYERDIVDKDVIPLSVAHCERDNPVENSSELTSLRKERKLLLVTVLKLQNQANAGNGTREVCRVDAAIQCKINVLGQMDNQGVSLSSELEGLRKALSELQAENDELEVGNKSLDEENSMLVEEKRSLEDSVNKLKSQITDALDSSLDEIEHLHQVVEELKDKLQLAEAKNERLRESIVELSAKNAEHLTSVVDEIERKDSLEDVIDFLAREVERLLKINNLAVENTNEPLISWDSMWNMHNSSLLSEIKACKELIDSQRDQIRQLQLDKRDVEDRYSNLKRELFILRSKRVDERILRPPNADVGKGNMQTRKSSHERYEFLKQEILRLNTRRTELEDLIGTLKSDNSNLEEEKVCLLDSLYHQVERNEWLEVKVDNLRSVIRKQQNCTTNERVKDENENELESVECVGAPLGQTKESMKIDLEGSLDSLATKKKPETKPVGLGDQLPCVQSGVQEQNKSSKTEKELRELITLLKRECAVVKSQLEKAQQFSSTLQECLRESHEEKQEILESLDEVTEEKAALESKVEMSENQLNELNERHQLLKDELESVRDNSKVKARKQQMAAVHAKLMELCRSLCSDVGEVEENSTLRTEEVTSEDEEATMESKLEMVSQEISLHRKELKRVKSDREKLKTRLETVQTENVALQKFVRELDEKRRQVKSFVMKLTEEKEFISEQMDEIKQQKNNLADALENVYQSKEHLQCKLEDALRKQQEHANSCVEATAETQSLKNSLCRLAEERDALKDALLKVKEEVCALQKSEAKLQEKITTSQAEADQSVDETSDLINIEESQTIRRLKAEKNELQERLGKLRMNQISSPERNIKSCEGDIQVSVPSEYGSNPQPHATMVSFEDVAYEDATKTTSELQVSDDSVNNNKNVSKRSTHDALQVRYNEMCAENKVLLEDLKRKAEDIEQLTNWFDSIAVEKDNIEKEQERVAKENEQLLHDLERAQDEKKKLKIRVEEILKQKREHESENQELDMCDVQASLKEKVNENEQLQQELQKRGDVCKELKESLQLATMRNRSLESEANESWEKATALEKSLKFFKEKNDSLNKRISLLQKENEKLTKDCKSLEKFNESVAEQCEHKKNEISRLVKRNELLENQLEEKSKEIKEIKEILENTVKEKKDLDGLVKEMKNREESTERNYQQVLNDNKIIEETLLKLRAEKNEIEEILRKLRQDLESTVDEHNDEIISLKNSLKATQDHLDATEEDLELAEEERDELKDQVERITENQRLLRQEINLKSQEDGNLKKSIEKLTMEKDSLQRTLEAYEKDCNKMKCELEDLKTQTDAICSYFARATKNFVEPQGKASDISQYVRVSIEAFLSERDSLITSLAEEKEKLERAEVDSNKLREEMEALREDLAKAERAKCQVRDDNKQLLSERTELTAQLQEALGEKEMAKGGTTKHTREDVRLSREISDVRSLIEKLSLQKEKLGAALVHKENQIAAVTAAASEKDKKLEEKEKEAYCLSHSKDEVSVALMAARDSCVKVKAELEGEKKRIASLTQELDNAKKQLGRSEDEKSDLKICVSKLDKEKTTLQKSLATAKGKFTDLGAHVQKLEEENAKIKQRKSELEEDLKVQTESLTTSQQLNKEIEEKWINELNEKESQLRLVNEDMEKSRMTELNLKEIVDDLRSKISELESRCCQAELAHQEMTQIKNNTQKKLDFEIEAKKASNTKTTDLERALSKYREENKDLKKCIASIDKDKHSLQICVKEAEGKKKEIEQRLAELTSGKRAVEDELEMTKSKVGSVRDELSTKIASLLESEKKVNKLKNVINEENQKFVQLQVERDALKKSVALTESELRQAETRIGVTKEQNVKLKEKLEAIEKEMTSLNSAVDRARRKEEDLRFEMKTQRGRVENELEEKNVECNTLKEKLERECMNLQQERHQRKGVEEKFGKFREEHETLKKSAKDLRSECGALMEKLKDSLEEKCELERALELTRGQSRSIQEELLKLKEECATLKTSSKDLRTECSTLNSKLKRSVKERSQIDEELRQDREEKRRVEEELLRVKEEFTALQNSSQKFEKDLRLECGTLKEKFESSLKERVELEKELELAHSQRKVLEEELLKLEKDNESVKNFSQTFAIDTEDAGEVVKAEVNESMVQCTEEELFSMATAMESRLTTASDRNSLEDEITKERDISSDLRDQLEETMDEKDELEEIVEELKAKTRKLQGEIDSLLLEKDSLEDKLDENTKFFKEQIGALNDEKKELSRKLEVLLKDKSSLSEERTTKDLDDDVALDERKKLEDALEKSNQEISRLSNELGTCLARHRAVEVELQKSEENFKELLNKFEESSLRNQDIMNELAEIKNENSKLRLVLEEMTTLAEEGPELESRTVEKDQDHQLAHLQVELDEKNKKIASLQDEIIEYKRMRHEEERNFRERETNLAAARQEFYKTYREKWEEEERMESVRRANNRLQEALEIAKDETNQLRKQLQDVNDRERLVSANNIPDTLVASVRVKKTSVGEQPERGVEKVMITSSEVPELSQVPPATEMNEPEEAPIKVIPLENAKKEIALLESHVQELRSDLRKARDQVFDLQHELSDASRALKQQECLQQQERERFQTVIDETEKECDKLRSDLSSLIAMEKKRSSFTTAKDLKSTLRKAETDILDAISKTADFLRRARIDIREHQMESDNDNSEKLSRRSRSLIVTSAEKMDLLRQIDDASKERERLEKKLKRAEGTKVLLQKILNETLAELERFKRLVDFADHQGHETSSSKQIAEITTKELETQSYLTSSDFEEAQKRLEELRKNIRELEGCLEEEKSKGQLNVVDHLKVNKKLQTEKRALQQLLNESENKSEALQTTVDNVQSKLELAQKEKAALEKEFAGVRREVAMLRNLSYDEREEKNSLKRENAELKRVLLESKENDAPGANEKEENEEMLKRAKEEITELLTGKEALEKQNVTMQRELRIKEENYEEHERKYSDLANKYRAMEERWKGMADRCATMEGELQVKNDSLGVLNKELTNLNSEFVAREERWKSADEERIKLVEDAHLFKLTLEKKNQDLVSIIESKEHEVISLEAKIEGLVSLQRTLEGDVQSLGKEKDDALSQVRTLESSKERAEASNKELQNQIEQILLDKSDHDHLNVRLKNLLSENNRLDALNESLEATVQNLQKRFQEKIKDNESLIHERQELVSKFKQLETEKGKEAFLREQLASQLEEKDREMKTKTKVLSSRLDSVIKETENLKTSSGKMEQMGIEFSRLEDENTHLIETVEKVREENVTLKKENDLLRRACHQLRARKPAPEEKMVAYFQSGEVGSKPVFRKDFINKLTGHHLTADSDDHSLANKAGQGSSGKPLELTHGIRLSRGSAASLSAVTEDEIRPRMLREHSAERQRSQGTPPVKHHQRTSGTEAEIKPQGAAPVFKGPSPAPSDAGSSRSSEADHSVCTRNYYCSPILSLVDTCPLHRNPSIERPPSQCPICRKDRRRGSTVPKEFVSLEKYV